MLKSTILFLVTFSVIVATAAGLKPGEPYYEFASGQVLVKFNRHLTGAKIAEMVTQFGGSIAHRSDLLDYYRIDVPADKSVAEAVAYFRSTKDVDWANFNYIAHANWIPNDPNYSYQWHYPLINMPAAWDITRGSNTIIVAVADQGWQFNHQDFAGVQIVSPRDEVDVDNDPSEPNLEDSHGMHTAGTILAATNNGVGVAGVAPNCRLMPIRALGNDGSGTTQQIADGIAWAGAHGAHVLNLSLGYGIQNNEPPQDPGPPLSTAVSQAAAAGTIMCVSSGNDGADYVSYPAAYDVCIAVGATSFNDAIAPYSNRGTALDITAPGGNTSEDLNNDGYVDGVLSTVRNVANGDYYTFWQGTSMAAPHASGVAALLISNGLAANQVRTALQTTAVDLGAAGRDNTFGHGRINAHAALLYNSGGGETTIYEESFDETAPGWNNDEQEADGVGWNFLNDLVPDPDCDDNAHSGNAVWHDDEEGIGHQDDYLTSPVINLPANMINMHMTVWQRNCYIQNFYEYHGLLYKIDGAANWTEFYQFSQVQEEWTLRTFDLDNSLAGHTIQFSFRYQGTYATEWFLDDFRVYGTAGTAVDETPAAMLNSFTLGEPFPNPFNPAIQIPFELNRDTRINLSIYNVLGQKIADLLSDQIMNAGTQKITWNAADQTSGIYLVKLENQGQVQTKKILLVK